MTTRQRQTIVPLVGALCISPAAADSTDARCDNYSSGSDHTDKMPPCVFSSVRDSDAINTDPLGSFDHELGA
jgi:hypothetical protein